MACFDIEDGSSKDHLIGRRNDAAGTGTATVVVYTWSDIRRPESSVVARSRIDSHVNLDQRVPRS